jgi:hypothetical protein
MIDRDVGVRHWSVEAAFPAGLGTINRARRFALKIFMDFSSLQHFLVEEATGRFSAMRACAALQAGDESRHFEANPITPP